MFKRKLEPSSTPRMRSPRRRYALIAAGACGCALLAAVHVPLPDEMVAPALVHSLRVTDRNGIALREFLNDRQGRGQWRALDRIAVELQQAVIAIEDRRFYYHPGVDPVAVVRATYENLLERAFISGGSTITQQVVRSIEPRPRTLAGKFMEAWTALRLERMMSKDRILEQYLNRAPFGNQTYGAESASRHYFGKPAADLSLAEAAFLAGLPNAPTSLNPYRSFREAQRRQSTVLKRMLRSGFIESAEYERASVQPIHLVPPEVNFRAPHAVEQAVRIVGSRFAPANIRTTIDYPMQSALQAIVRGHLALLTPKNVTNAAVVVIENETGKIRVLLGSANYFDEEHSGQVNGALALRQPGSAIKPLTYGTALEHGFTPATIIADVPLNIPDKHGSYTPENYDRRYHGPVRLRTALACSYNIPAVRTAQAIGLPRLMERYRSAGLTTLTEPEEVYGYGLTLGNADVTLLELTNAYATIARSGLWKPVIFIERSITVDGVDLTSLVNETAPPRQVFDPVTAALLTDILSDPVAKRPAFGNVFRFPFPCAVKTGTTKDFRDNWTLGFTSVYTVGVWAGNFDGSPMRGVSGITGAGAIFTDIMMTLHDRRKGVNAAPFEMPARVEQKTVCARSGLLPNSECGTTIVEKFAPGTAPREYCAVHRRFLIVTDDGRLQERVYELLPYEYRDWARSQGIPVPPSNARPVGTRTVAMEKRTPHRLALLSPMSGDYFKLDPVLRSEFQTVLVRAYVPPPAGRAELLVDGTAMCSLSDGIGWWRLQRGVHRLQVQAELQGRRMSSKSVLVTVD